MDDRTQSGLWNRNPQTGFYEQVAPLAQAAPSGPYQYYQPPRRQTTHGKGRSFSERTADNDPTDGSVYRSDSTRQHDTMLATVQAAAAPMREFMTNHPESLSSHLAKTQHVNSTDLPGSSQQPPLNTNVESIPANLRSKVWSPEPISPRTQLAQAQPFQQKPRQVSNASNTSAVLRRGSVSDRSPLQNLESWSKEEKRARVKEAENRTRARSSTGNGGPSISREGTLGSGKGGFESHRTSRRSRQEITDEDIDRQPYNDAPVSPRRNEEQSGDVNNALDAKGSPPEGQGPIRSSSASATRPNELKQSSRVPTASHRQPFHRPSAVTGDVEALSWSRRPAPDQRLSMDTSMLLGDEYRHRARNTGFTGALAAASAGAGIASNDGAAQRGKAAYERRKSQMRANRYMDENADGAGGGEIQRDSMQRPLVNQQAAESGDKQILGPRPSTQGDVRKADPVRFAEPPQIVAGQDVAAPVRPEAKDDPYQDDAQSEDDDFSRDQRRSRSYQPSSKPLDEWRQSGIARLSVRDLEFEQTIAAKAATAAAAASSAQKNAAWWEKGHRRQSSSPNDNPAVKLAQYDGPYEEQAHGFRPILRLRCGPLLRYNGIRKETASRSNAELPADREIWRGTIMIVTEDDRSQLSSAPVLRLFAQPMDLLPPPPHHHFGSGHDLSPEHEDPVAGQVKLSRRGRALYVRPIHNIEGDVDLSREENPDGLYAAVRAPPHGPQSTTVHDWRNSPHATFQDQNRIKNRDGEKAERFREVKAIRLHSERGRTFWRFSIEIELGSKQYRVAYRINRGPALSFWVPAKGETMNIMFHSCNGFSRSVDPNQFSGPDPLWRDVLNRHQTRPFHVMIGGGDQIYNDVVTDEANLFKDWLQTKNSVHKYQADFTEAMQDELETFYLERYAMWFSQGLFAMANSQIPMINIWDDHDIIDGFGSYPHSYMRTPVFSGLGAVAYKYYLLFQHQSIITETAQTEPSWLLGETPGPYINEVSRSVFMHLGRKVAFLGLDCRTERTWDEILSQRTYDIVFDRCRREIVKGETNHLIVLLGVPIAYPRLNFLENILTSRAMEPIKAIGKTGMLGGFVNKFDGGVEILDDLNDHWTAKHHKAERNWFIQELQELAAEKSVRITILGGDVHLGAIGQFFTPKKMGVSKDQDHRYMTNVISSAIVNTPPPIMMADVLNRRNKVHHLDYETDEDMIPMFSHDVDGSRRNNARLLPRRNYCTIREYLPGATPPPTPPPEPDTPAVATAGEDDENGSFERRFPPGSMTRTMSLTRGTANLVRRLSASSRSRKPPALAKPYGSLGQQGVGPMQRANSLNIPRPNDPQARPTFHRRPTDLSVKEVRKAAAKGGADGTLDGREPGHIDLEGGLDISLNMEINQHDPSGATIPYRLLVPALWYDGPADRNASRFKSHRASLMDRLKSFRRREMPVDHTNNVNDYSNQGSRTSSPTPPQRRSESETEPPELTMGLTNTGRGAFKHAQRANPKSGDRYDDEENDDGEDDDDDDDDDSAMEDPRNAYRQGYNLSSPPIGLAPLVHPQSGSTRSATTRQPSYALAAVGRESSDNQRAGHRRHVSAPVSTRHQSATLDADVGSDEDSQISVHNESLPVRRPSKAERFLGIGDGDIGGPWQAVDGQRKPSLQLERADAAGRTGQFGRQGSLRRKLGWKGWKA